MSVSGKPLHIDIPAKLKDVKTVYGIDALAFEGDLPASIFHLQLITPSVRSAKSLREIAHSPSMRQLRRHCLVAYGSDSGAWVVRLEDIYSEERTESDILIAVTLWRRSRTDMSIAQRLLGPRTLSSLFKRTDRIRQKSHLTNLSAPTAERDRRIFVSNHN